MYIILDNQVDMLFEIFFQILFKKEIQVDSNINISLTDLPMLVTLGKLTDDDVPFEWWWTLLVSGTREEEPFDSGSWFKLT